MGMRVVQSAVNAALVAATWAAEHTVPGPARLGLPLSQKPVHADPVVLVPGFANGASMLGVLKRSLEADGFSVAVFDDPEHGLGDYRLAAARLDALVAATMSAAHASHVDLVTYSAGVTVARTWLAEHATAASSLDSLVDVDGRWHGDDDHRFLDAITSIPGIGKRALGALPVAELQMQTGSDLFRELDAHPAIPSGVRVTSIMPPDRMLRDTIPGATNIVLPDRPNHLQIVRSSETAYAAIRGALLAH